MYQYEFAAKKNYNLVIQSAIPLTDAYYDTNATYAVISQSTYGHIGPNNSTYYAVGQMMGPSITIASQKMFCIQILRNLQYIIILPNF